MLQFPPIWISVHAFTDYLGDPQWFASTVLSFQVAALAVAIGCLTGSAAAVALHGRRFPGKGLGDRGDHGADRGAAGGVRARRLSGVRAAAYGGRLGGNRPAARHAGDALRVHLGADQPAGGAQPAAGALGAQPRRRPPVGAAPRGVAGDPPGRAGGWRAKLRRLVRRGGRRVVPARAANGYPAGAHVHRHPVRADAEGRRQRLLVPGAVGAGAGGAVYVATQRRGTA